MSLKFLYTFNVDREIEKEVTEETSEGKLTKKIREKVPVIFKFFLIISLKFPNILLPAAKFS